ncbi:DUF928 domain-containing protein [Coleofasciculus sp. FACHB-64]|uniref:DUF928 domain-containing protein n=1 Tax=Cyanophyceae TaxID=3028117 RepID=UPI001684F3F2|nr:MULTISPECIES: DUF928 domain-containing protein [unclassified Coleofasciculus]MBD1944568.1 DUF928 domain-containing protein [Coleofasciculus sp. FACHB-712]MBD2046409.1 DUF928 domain-containing protein [Coleofasciculus sp. FACHB-64]
MVQHKSFTTQTLVAFFLSLGLIIAPSFLTKAIAQSESVNQSQTLAGTSIGRVTFEPPGSGQPDDTAGGASRGDECPQAVIATGECVTPLVPIATSKLTVAEHPTFLVYVPPTSAKEIFFGLVDENNNFHYQAKIPISSQEGILSFKLPDNAPPLEIDKKYRWTFIIIGEQGLRPGSPGVQGEIRRVKLTSEVMSQLQNQPLLERAALYGKHGIWFDTVASLAEARRLEPSEATLASTWQELLNSIGLQAIATKPFLN